MRLLAPISLLLAAVALVACGGSSSGTGGKKVSSTTDPQKILADTFSASGKKVESGKFNMTLKLDVSGGSSTLNGPVNVTLGGPFESQGKGKVPKFKVDLAFAGAGQNIKAGATSTGDKGFLNYNGQDYAVPDNVFKQFASGYTQAQSQNKSKGGTLKELGIQPQTWLKDAKVDSSSSVGGTDTVKVSGGVDVPKMLDDLNTLLGKAGSLGLPNAGTLPSSLTAQQKTQIEKAVKSASVEIETGKDDSILRRIAFTLDISDATGSGGKANVAFDLSLTDLGQSQSISEPSSTKPLNDLLSQLGGLGTALGGLGGSSSSSSGSGSSSAAAGKYTQCVKDAGTDVSKAQQCASLLTP
jgi:hypothetical protein